MEGIDVGDAQQVGSKKSKAKLRKQLKEEELKNLLDIKAFRDFVWEVLGDCMLYEEIFTGNSHTFYNAGKRAIGLDLLRKINLADISAYVKMQKENTNYG